jgi:hypothetical protein
VLTDEPLQLSDVNAAGCYAPARVMYKIARACEDLKCRAPTGFFKFNSEGSYVSKKYRFTKYNTLLLV